MVTCCRPGIYCASLWSSCWAFMTLQRAGHIATLCVHGVNSTVDFAIHHAHSQAAVSDRINVQERSKRLLASAAVTKALHLTLQVIIMHRSIFESLMRTLKGHLLYQAEYLSRLLIKPPEARSEAEVLKLASYLTSLQRFQEVPQPQLVQLAKEVTYAELTAGAFVCKQGERPTALPGAGTDRHCQCALSCSRREAFLLCHAPSRHGLGICLRYTAMCSSVTSHTAVFWASRS